MPDLIHLPTRPRRPRRPGDPPPTAHAAAPVLTDLRLFLAGAPRDLHPERVAAAMISADRSDPLCGFETAWTAARERLADALAARRITGEAAARLKWSWRAAVREQGIALKAKGARPAGPIVGEGPGRPRPGGAA